MRTSTHPLRGRAGQREDTAEDALADQLSKTYTVIRQKALGYVDEAGRKQTMLMDMAIPAHSLLVEIQKRQDSKNILAEMARERVARANGWHVCRLTEREAKSEDVLYFINREIERSGR